MKSFPAVAYLLKSREATFVFSKQGAQQQKTSWYPKVNIIFCLEMCPIGSHDAVSLAITVQSYLMNTSTFCFLNTMLPVLSWLIKNVCLAIFGAFCQAPHRLPVHMQLSPGT